MNLLIYREVHKETKSFMFIREFNKKILIALLLASGISVNAIEPNLIEAARKSDSESLRSLLEGGTDPNTRQADGATALHWSVHKRDIESVNLLLESNADVNATNRMGASPLFLAARNGDADLIEKLLSEGANPNLELEMGETVLMTAARSGTVEGVRFLIQAGADLNRSESSRDQTALMWAAAQGHLGVVRELIAAGANINDRSKVRSMLMFVDGSNGGAFDHGVMENLGGYSPLLFAAKNGHLELAEVLLQSGANIDGPSGNGATPLVVAVHSGHSDLAAMLLDHGADPNSISAGYNALHAAILRGDSAIIEALLQHGADPNQRILKATPTQRASEDWVLRTAHVTATPYWLAANFREPAIMKTLVGWGADSSLTNEKEYERLRDRRSRENPPSIDERRVVGGYSSPIQSAIKGESRRGRFYVQANQDPTGEEKLALESVIVAADHGVNIDAIDFNGSTALHDAALRNLSTIVMELAIRGASINVLNDSGQTPLDLAILGERRLASNILASETPESSSPSARAVLEGLGALKSEEL